MKLNTIAVIDGHESLSIFAGAVDFPPNMTFAIYDVMASIFPIREAAEKEQKKLRERHIKSPGPEAEIVDQDVLEKKWNALMTQEHDLGDLCLPITRAELEKFAQETYEANKKIDPNYKWPIKPIHIHSVLPFLKVEEVQKDETPEG
jgi:hypothetical protein